MKIIPLLHNKKTNFKSKKMKLFFTVLVVKSYIIILANQSLPLTQNLPETEIHTNQPDVSL